MGSRENVKNGKTAPRAKSVTSQSSQPQTRSLRKHAAPPTALYKTSSDTALAKRVGSLSLHTTQSGRASSELTRRRLPSATSSCCNSLHDVAQLITDKKAKNVVVMVGAGISTCSGIPDFRSPGTGLYANLKQYRIPYPEAIFDIDYFESNPRPFFTLAKEIYPCTKFKPNYTHYFLRLLHEKGVLLRVYTQNIDGLERMAGLPDQKLVEAHGSFMTASCARCRHPHAAAKVKESISENKVPQCTHNGCTGFVKPDIVFFGEDLPKRFYYYLKDFPQADLLLVMGTSLEVEPFAGIVDSVRFYVPRVLFNRSAVGPFEKKRRMNDVVAAGDIRSKLRDLVTLLGWTDDLNQIIREMAPHQDPDETNAQVSKPDSNTDGVSDTETPSVTQGPSHLTSASRVGPSLNHAHGAGTRSFRGSGVNPRLAPSPPRTRNNPNVNSRPHAGASATVSMTTYTKSRGGVDPISRGGAPRSRKTPPGFPLPRLPPARAPRGRGRGVGLPPPHPGRRRSPQPPVSSGSSSSESESESEDSDG